MVAFQESRVENEHLETQEIWVPRNRILSHFLYTKDLPDPVLFQVVPAEKSPAPIFSGSTYFANIGTPHAPLLLELRFEPIDSSVLIINPNFPQSEEITDERAHIALLMTNERWQHELEAIGTELYKRVRDERIDYEVIITPESLGPKLSQEMARAAWLYDRRKVYTTSLQKGKLQVSQTDELMIGSPKPWISEDFGVTVQSGTSRSGTNQKMYLDPKIGAKLVELGYRILLVDDARLTSGTISSAIELLEGKGLTIAGVATVLNEADPVNFLDDKIPFVWLTKLPLFAQVAHRFQPIPGTFQGLKYFYIPQFRK